MYWVVFRFGVMDWAVMVLRTAVLDYVSNSQITTEPWEALFQYPAPLVHLRGEEQNKKAKSPIVQRDEALSKTINRLLGKEVFDELLVGGPFGREGQLRLGRSMPGVAFLRGHETLLEGIKRRQELWDKCYPWTDGLAKLFDVAQEKLTFQAEALGEDGRRADFATLVIPANSVQTLIRAEVRRSRHSKSRRSPLAFVASRARCN